MTEASRPGYRQALRHRDFRLLTSSTFVNALGSWAFTIVLQVYVFDRTHSTLWLAILPAASWITGSIVGPFAGVVADRYDRRRLLVTSAAVNAVLLALMTLVVALNAPIGLLPVLSVLIAVAASPVEPAAGALVPDVVDERSLGAANGLLALLENVVVVVGPAIGGLLLLTHRPAIAVGFDALSFAVAGAISARLQVRSVGDSEAGASALADLRAGVRAVTPTATVLIGIVTLDTAVYGASSVLFVPLSRHLGTGSAGASYLLVASAVGAIAAAAVAERLSRSRRLAAVIVLSLLVEAMPFAVTAVTTSPVVAALMQVISGAGMVVVDVIGVTALQREVPRAYLSRVLALMYAALTLGTVVATFLGSVSYSLVGLHATLLIIGVGFSAVGLLTLPVLIRGDRASAAEIAAIAPTVDLIAALDLFTDVTRNGLEALVRSAERRSLAPGEVLIAEGEPAEALYVLTAGRLEVSTTREGGRPDVVAPAYVGEIGLLRGIDRTATVTAATDAEVLVVSKQAFVTATEAAPPSRSMLETAGARAGCPCDSARTG